MNQDDIRRAHRRIMTRIRRTPVLEIEAGTFGTDQQLSLKLELLQHAGSFKTRGAFNNLIARNSGKAGVAAASGGNHGLAVAYAAKALGIPARIFVPEIASKVKIDAIQALGVEVEVTGAHYAEALAACEAYQAETGAIDVHAYGHPDTIAGQGTVAIEWERQAPDLDTVLIAVGGGGLISGIAAYYDKRVKVIAVEPERAPSLHAALAAGEPVDVEVGGIAADSLGARRIGDHNYAVCKDQVAASILIPDEAIIEARHQLWQRCRIAAEAGAAAALAALIGGIYKPAKDERVGALICGGNVDPSVFTGSLP